jgi:hypothetical protein
MMEDNKIILTNLLWNMDVGELMGNCLLIVVEFSDTSEGVVFVYV